MSAIAFELPDDVIAVRDGVLRFVEKEVAPRLDKNHTLLADARQLYDAQGAHARDVRDLIHDVRIASA